MLVISNYSGYHQTRPEAAILVGLATKKGYAITVLTFENCAHLESFAEAGIKVIYGHPVKKKDAHAIDLIDSELKKGGYDLLMLFNNLAISNGLIAAKRHSAKVIIYRGAASNMAWYNPVNYFKFYHPRIDMVICNSDEIRQNFASNPFFESKKAVTISKGHDVTWYDGVATIDVRDHFGLPPQSFVFVTVANNRKVKGISYLVEAIHKIETKDPISFIIIGQGYEKWSAKIEDSANKQVRFTGYIEDVLTVVKSCDGIIIPSIGSEALTKSLIEAMSMEVTPIITDLWGNRALVEHGKVGYVVPPRDAEALRDAILRAVEHREAFAHLGKNARLHIANHFSISDTIDKYDEAFSRFKTSNRKKMKK